MTNFAFRIDTAEHYAVEQGINGAPHYNIRVANAVRRTIEVIHGLQDLHLRAGLDDIEVYLGRSSHSSDHVLSRWRSHREHRGHKFATVLFTCDAERAERLEGVAVKILKRLKNYGTLCVSNANVMGGGGAITDICVTAEKLDECTPCGGCRQRLAEFAPADARVHLTDQAGITKTLTMAELLPLGFSSEGWEP